MVRLGRPRSPHARDDDDPGLTAPRTTPHDNERRGAAPGPGAAPRSRTSPRGTASRYGRGRRTGFPAQKRKTSPVSSPSTHGFAYVRCQVVARPR
ncbi:predicted protein [Streptomyces sp. SPB78]|nr:predicted protein [Streptomyces sp. SPB78]